MKKLEPEPTPKAWLRVSAHIDHFHPLKETAHKIFDPVFYLVKKVKTPPGPFSASVVVEYADTLSA